MGFRVSVRAEGRRLGKWGFLGAVASGTGLGERRSEGKRRMEVRSCIQPHSKGLGTRAGRSRTQFWSSRERVLDEGSVGGTGLARSSAAPRGRRTEVSRGRGVAQPGEVATCGAGGQADGTRRKPPGPSGQGALQAWRRGGQGLRGRRASGGNASHGRGPREG